MITKETCVKICHCHKEIGKCEKAINDIAEALKNDAEKQAPSFKERI